MIPIELFDYTQNKEVDVLVTRYVNNNLASIVAVVLDLLNDNCGFDLEGFLPRDYLERKPKECRRLVDELYELLISDVLRYHIKPKYEYLLYSIISWWDNCTDFEQDLIPNSLDEDLLKKIESEESYISEEGKNIILENITTYESYYNICFKDHDFLPENLTCIVTLFLHNPDLFYMFYHDLNLREYEDLMPCDLRELYYEKNSIVLGKSLEIQDLEQGIIYEIISALQLLELRVVEIENRDEVEISNDIYSNLIRVLKVRFGLESTREMTIGRANKKLGETDLYIYMNNQLGRVDYTIIENKNIEKFKSQYYQLLGYLNQNFKFGVTVSINKNLKFEDAIKKIKNTLKDIMETDQDFKITQVCNPFKEFPYAIMSSHIVPEDSTREMPIYHLILNLHDSGRRKTAKIARRK